jgi:uncharacterized membrane protein YbaN (DUF454 family)
VKTMSVIYKGRVFSVEVEQHRFPDGREHEVAIVRHPPSVVLLPVADDGRVILAAFCFARSSPALHDRLLDSRTFGKAIRDWRTHRAISRKGKTASVLAMALSLAASLVLAVDLAGVGLQALAASAAAAFILTRSTSA